MRLLVLLSLCLGIVFFYQTGGEPMPTMQLLQTQLNDDDAGLVSVGDCEAEKCVMVYLAPWCGTCRAASPMIVQMKAQLEQEGIPMQVVIGNANGSQVQQYAAQFPFNVALDPMGAYSHQLENKGVPYFVVFNKKGKRVSDYGGAYLQVDAMRGALEI
ncbi:hypothetical protein VST7929_01243 [Vibrio stylophorae]|uniref:Thioredoxin domain-containing protein n=1 Tax=Vibrio stylophorae TaxID=659351 RepID=A0ABN8DTM3_9VIBR|nr:TlpA disulfide reductase family protein [Vibrio stylophorae]CAH0533377.1 hypothetical protein VST7929_01243 [Vibrio stylophorae]